MNHSNICDLTAENAADEQTLVEAPENAAEAKFNASAATIDDLEEMDFSAPEENRWKIADDSAADWAIRKIAVERAEFERIEALAKAEIDRINEKLEAARKRYENGSSYLTACLAAYFETVEPKKTKTKASYRLLSGTLTKKIGGPVMKHDDEKLMHYLVRSHNDDMIQVVEKVRWAEFKKRLQIVGDKVVDVATGEVVDGVSVEIKPDTFQIDF